MAETKTSISELTAATSVNASDVLFVSQQSGSAWNSRKATVGQLPFGQGTVTGITMNGASKGTSGVVDLGTVLTAHQSLTGYVPTSRKVNDKQLTADVTLNATDVSAVALTGDSTVHGELKVTDGVQTPYISYNNDNYGIGFDDTRYTAYFWNQDAEIDLPKVTANDQIVLSSNLTNYYTKAELTGTTGVLTGYSLTSHTHDGYVPTSRKINGTQLTADLNVGTVTGITMNGASKGTSGVVDLGTVLTAHQSLAGYVPTSRTVAGQQLTANVTAATISSAIGLSNYYLKSETSSAAEISSSISFIDHRNTILDFGNGDLSAFAWTGEIARQNMIDAGLAGEQSWTKMPVNVTIGSSVTSIGYDAFDNCSGLTSVTIPDSVTSIGDYAFYACSLTSVTIPDSVTSIGGAAFCTCSDLTSVTIGDGVTSIGNGAFSGCSGLKSVTIGNGVTSIESSMFYGCSDLKSVTIPDSVTSIGASAFRDCLVLRSVTIPDSVTSIGALAFLADNGLRSIIVKGKTQAEAEALLANAQVPAGCTISTWNYVPTSRTVAGQALSANVTAATISSAINLANYSLTSHTHSSYVPTSRKVAGQQLTADVTPATISSAIGLSNYSTTSHTHNYVIATRKVAGQMLTADVTAATISSAISLAKYSLTSHNHDSTYLKIGNSATNYMATLAALSSNDVTPASDTGKSYITQANDGGHFGGMQVYAYASGIVRNRLFARKKINGSNVDTTLYLLVNADKSRSAELTFSPGYNSDNYHIATTSWVKTIKSYGMAYANVSPDGVMSNYTVNRAVVGGTPTSNKVRYYIPKYISGYSRHFYLSFNNNVSNTATLSVYVQSQSGENNTLWATSDLASAMGSGPITVAKGANRVFEFVEFANGAFLIDVQVANNKTSQLTAY